MKRILILVFAAAALIACTTETVYVQQSSPNEGLPADMMNLGAICTTNGVCADGLQCLGFYQSGECTEEKACTKECEEHSECKELDSRALCLTGCDGKSVCTLVQFVEK